MSAIASLIRVPVSTLPRIKEAAVPVRGFFGRLRDAFPDALKTHGSEVGHYEWSGYVLATVLAYLAEKDIELMKSEYVELAEYISGRRNITCFHLYCVS